MLEYNEYGFPVLPKKPKSCGRDIFEQKADSIKLPVNSKMQALAGRGMGDGDLTN